MKINSTIFRKPASWIVITTALFVIPQVGGGKPAIAQTAQDLQQADQSLNNVFSGADGTGGSSIFNLLNRIQLLNGRSPGEFAAEQTKNLNSEFAEFRKKQQLKLDSPEIVPTAPGTSQSDSPVQ